MEIFAWLFRVSRWPFLILLYLLAWVAAVIARLSTLAIIGLRGTPLGVSADDVRRLYGLPHV